MLASLGEPIYKIFCQKEFLSAALLEIRGAYDVIYILTLINYL